MALPSHLLHISLPCRFINYLCSIKTRVSHIVAFDNHRAIGANNQLLWHLPDDFKWFVKNTKGKAVIMGRKTMQSLPGGPLKNRLNIVISRSNLQTEGFQIENDISSAIQNAAQFSPDEVFIIGGEQIYRQTLEITDRLYITKVHHAFENTDAFYPEFNTDLYKEIFREFHPKDEKHAYDFEFIIYEKI